MQYHAKPITILRLDMVHAVIPNSQQTDACPKVNGPPYLGFRFDLYRLFTPNESIEVTNNIILNKMMRNNTNVLSANIRKNDKNAIVMSRNISNNHVIQLVMNTKIIEVKSLVTASSCVFILIAGSACSKRIATEPINRH